MIFDRSIYIKDDKYLDFIYLLLKEFVNPNSFSSSNKKAITKYIDEINQDKLFIFIKRHKLITILKDSKVLKEYFPDFYHKSKIENKKYIFVNFKIANFITYLVKTLNNENISFLIFKGIPLSIKEYKKFDGRGLSSDIDILINPKELNKLVLILEKNKFKIIKNDKSYLYKGIKGYYSRFVFNELNLISLDNSSIYLDIHWRINWIHNKEYNFNKIYKRRIYVNFKGTKIPTMCFNDSLYYLVKNTEIENSMCLRNIIDINQIISNNNIKQIYSLKNYYNSSKIFALTYTITKNKKLLGFIDKDPTKYTDYIMNARKFQKLPYRSFGSYRWKLSDRIIDFNKKIYIVKNFKSLIALILFNLLPPKYFFDSEGNEISLLESIKNRISYILYKINRK